jgi:hypothetical protein
MRAAAVMLLFNGESDWRCDKVSVRKRGLID